MALTINTYPVQQNNRAEWNITTSLVEDASHVNLRIRAAIYGPAGILAQIEQPKGSPDFDFTELLYRFINYKIPALAPSLTFTQQLIPKAGSNFITDWTNDGTAPMDGYVDQGNNFLFFQHASGNYGQVNSNNFSVTKGKMYCLFLIGGVIINTNTQVDQVGNGLDVYQPYKLSMATLPAQGRYIIFAAETGTAHLVFGAHDVVSWTGFPSVAVELYELNDCDWYLPYTIVWSEVYETAAGVTTVVDSDDCMKGKSGQCLFKAPGLTEAEFAASFILGDNTKRFLNAYTYLDPNFSKSQIINKNPPSTQGSYNIWIGVLPKNIFSVQGFAAYTNASGVYVNQQTIAAAVSYHPIMALAIGNSDYTTTRHYAYIRLQSDDTAPVTVLSIDHNSNLNLKTYPRLIELMWLNQYGGFTSLCLSDGLKENLISERTDYEVPSDVYIKRRVAKAKKYWLVECETAILNPKAPDGLADLILSEYVLYSKETGVFKEVFIRDREILLADNGNINKIRIAFEYAD